VKLEEGEGEPNIGAVIDANGMLYVWKECNIQGRVLFRLMSKSFVESVHQNFIYSLKWFNFSEENKFVPESDIHED